MLGTILRDIEQSMTFKIKCERPEIQDVNVFYSISKKLKIKMKKTKKAFINVSERFLLLEDVKV
jgi:hypothetical protein